MRTYDDDVMTPAMVAEVFKVHPRTVSNWANNGKLPYFTTVGGHKRFNKKDVERLKDKLTVHP